jgi:pimeloyl-ACP methyl ester carboxylesterase/DNA-binding CsgD family transcriptional regulator
MGALSRFHYNPELTDKTNVPGGNQRLMGSSQRIRYITTADGSRLAWAEAGQGPLLVKAANWLTHLEYEWNSPIWQHWLRFFSRHWRFVRYDERGCGMTEWNGGDLSLDTWVADLGAVIEAARPSEPVVLLGISQGAAACIRYAIQNPERIRCLILYGGYARGAFHRGTPDAQAAYRAMIDLTRVAWGKENPTFRQVFTSRFIPGGTSEQLKWWNELCLRSTSSGEVAARLLESRALMEMTADLGKVQSPTLVLHARSDEVISIEEGRLLAAAIPNTEFVELDSRNHVLLEHEPAWQRFCEAVLSFTGRRAGTSTSPFSALSVRERQVLSLMAEGLSNLDIADRLAISEKTVRNHASTVFDKLGVWSRAQAIVFARDHGFTG